MKSILLSIDKKTETIVGCKIKEIIFKKLDDVEINNESFIIIGFNFPINGDDIILLKSYKDGCIYSLCPEDLLEFNRKIS